MAEVIVLHNQADDVATSVATLEARAIGWIKSVRVLGFTEDLGEGEKGGHFQVPSLVGQGMGRRVVSAGHGLSAGQALRLHKVSGAMRWDLAISTTDKSMLATHIVVSVVDTNTFDVAQVGAWMIGVALTGDLYLSDATAGALTDVAPTAHPAQRIGVGDGISLHLTIAPPSYEAGTPNLGDLGNVVIPGPANGSGLVWDSATSTWRERKITVSTADPTGAPADGDLWFKVGAA